MTVEGLALWYSPVADLGGVARHVVDAVREGVPGWRIIVMCPEGPLADKVRDLGAAVITGPVSPEDGMRAAVTAVRRAIARVRPDLVHTHLAFADLVAAGAATGLRSGRGHRVRLVSTEHGIAGVKGYYQSSAFGASAKAVAHRARLLRTDAVIAVSGSTRDQIRKQWGTGAPITVIRNGVDVPQDAPRPTPGLRVLSLARLATEKRIDLLLRAFAQVLAEHPEARLTIAGAGPEEKALRGLAGDLGLAGAVSFPGHVDAGEALAEHDVVVQLSDWENLSYTLLDAAAHGRGVVATDVGGNGEIVPARCLVDASDCDATAEAVVEQGLDLSARPGAFDSRPASVHEMCAGIAEVYRGMFR